MLRIDGEFVTCLSHDQWPNRMESSFEGEGKVVAFSAVTPALGGRKQENGVYFVAELMKSSRKLSWQVPRLERPSAPVACSLPKVGFMKISLLTVAVVSLALAAASMPASWADSAVQNGTPGAQGTEGTNPTHQDQDVTGPNGDHPSDSNPGGGTSTTTHKKHKKNTASSTGNSSNS
jgi:hypothetical protein